MLNKILFIGLGGAGQRHLRLFKKNLQDKKVEFIAYRTIKKTPLLNTDFTVNEKNTVEKQYEVKCFVSLKEALATKPDLAVISNPSSMHLKYAQICAEHGINVFVEKPLSNSTEGLENFKKTVEKNNVAVHVGFQRRFHPHFRKVYEILKAGKIGQILTVNFTVASFIPRWHPYEDYLELYACRKELGGGVLLTEIHEIDLTVWYFGLPSSVVCIGGTYSNVGMNVEDTVRLTLDYEEFLVQINLTFWQKHHERHMSICGENGYLNWNEDEDTLKQEYFNNADKNSLEYNLIGNSETMFDLQVKSIINEINLSKGLDSINDSLNSLTIIEAAKKSMQTKSVIMLK